MLRVRQMLTEILLGVTSEEIESVAREVYSKEKRKAQKGITSPHMPRLSAHKLKLCQICPWYFRIEVI